jgi:hypothetical protein
MRSFIQHPGPCESCGRLVICGAYWVNEYKILDFGVPGMPPIEPNMMKPRRCDDCEILHRLQDPDYWRLCGSAAESMEREAIASGGVINPVD